MPDHATPNLPSRGFDKTVAFYVQLGFETSWHDQGWLILERDGVTLEFFRYPDLDPAQSSFSCCLRLNDMAAFYRACVESGVPVKTTGWPRLHSPRKEHSGMTIAYLVDLDGSLLRLVQNEAVNI
ncbi:bleomycin resistance protein [Sphingorhabdus sp.]|uniref:bleomycin resistance protein n=1 Tax=Sphingorhabdus sp. TaxID=1902408 RepID=UPI003982DE66